MTTKDEAILAEITRTRTDEKHAIREARKHFDDWIREQVKDEHERVLEAVRVALSEGLSNSRIGTAYGSTDWRTIAGLIDEALERTVSTGNTPEWRIEHNDDGTFDIITYGLGDNKITGTVTCKMDDDGENFSFVEGEFAIPLQIYRLGYHEEVVNEVRKKNEGGN